MSLYRTISETEATGKVKAVYGTNRIANAYQVEPDVTPDPG